MRKWGIFSARKVLREDSAREMGYFFRAEGAVERFCAGLRGVFPRGRCCGDNWRGKWGIFSARKVFWIFVFAGKFLFLAIALFKKSKGVQVFLFPKKVFMHVL